MVQPKTIPALVALRRLSGCGSILSSGAFRKSGRPNQELGTARGPKPAVLPDQADAVRALLVAQHSALRVGEGFKIDPERDAPPGFDDLAAGLLVGVGVGAVEVAVAVQPEGEAAPFGGGECHVVVILAEHAIEPGDARPFLAGDGELRFFEGDAIAAATAPGAAAQGGERFRPAELAEAVPVQAGRFGLLVVTAKALGIEDGLDQPGEGQRVSPLGLGLERGRRAAQGQGRQVGLRGLG